MPRLDTFGWAAVLIGCLLICHSAYGEGVILGPHGPGGSLNGYYLETTDKTWDQARVDAAGRTFLGVSGHLATTTSAAENASAGSLGGGDRWIGLTDADVASSLDGFNPGTTEGNFVWVTGEPFAFSAWGGGEPNDSGGEDAAHIRGDGLWNDQNAGSTIGADQTNQTYDSIVEFDLGLTSLAGVKAFNVTLYELDSTARLAPVGSAEASVGVTGSITATTYIDSDGSTDVDGTTGISNLSEAVATVAEGESPGNATVNEVDIYSSGGSGNFTIDNPVPGLPPGADDFVVVTEGQLNSAGGLVDLGVNNDDGSRLRIDLNQNGTFDGGAEDVIVDDVIQAPHDVFASVNLLPGDTAFEYLFFERGGGAEGEFFTVDNSLPDVIDSLADAEQLISDSNLQDGPPVEGIADVINFLDSGPDGNFGDNSSFMGVTGDDFVLVATGLLEITEAGDYTFGINSDDGARLRIDGTDVIVTDAVQPPTDSFGSINLTEGLHEIELLYFERGGGAEVELFAAQGIFTSFDPAFQLLNGEGGLTVFAQRPQGPSGVIPEPSTAAVLALLGGAVALSRRRR